MSEMCHGSGRCDRRVAIVRAFAGLWGVWALEGSYGRRPALRLGAVGLPGPVLANGSEHGEAGEVNRGGEESEVG